MAPLWASIAPLWASNLLLCEPPQFTAVYFDADTYPAFHFGTDRYLALHFDADQDLIEISKLKVTKNAKKLYL